MVETPIEGDVKIRSSFVPIPGDNQTPGYTTRKPADFDFFFCIVSSCFQFPVCFTIKCDGYF